MKHATVKSRLPELRAWFADYVRRFSSGDPSVQRNMDIKAEHTLRVCGEIRDIGGSLGLSDEDLCTAEACGLLHDIGRFEQYNRYGTFRDSRSEDHAALGVKVIGETGVLEGVEPASVRILVRVVAHHNRAVLDVEEGERSLFFLKLLRDADKVDIWRVVTDYYRDAGNRRNPALELDLPDRDRISDRVSDSLMRGELVRMSDLETLNDFKLFQMGWIYDVNFPRTFRMVQERGYLEAIRDALPCSDRVMDLYARALDRLERGSRADDPFPEGFPV